MINHAKTTQIQVSMVKNSKFIPNIVLDRASAIPLCVQIAEQIKQEIKRYRSAPGTQVVSERQLATALHINRETVHQAYELLKSHAVVRERLGHRLGVELGTGALALYRTPFPAISVILPYKFTQQLEMASSYGLEIIAQIMDRAAEKQMAVSITPLPEANANDEVIENWLDSFIPRSIGIITLGRRNYALDRPFEKLLNCPDLPHVFVSGESALPHISSLHPDTEQGAYDMGQVLRQKGHQWLAVIGSFSAQQNNFITCSTRRAERVACGVERAGLKIQRLPINFESWNSDHVAQQIQALHPRPTALWVQNDDMALQLATALQKLHYQIPEDFSLIGFDDKYADRGLSSISYSRKEIGVKAVDIIEELYLHSSPGKAINRTVPCHFIARNSIKIPRNN